MKFYNMAMSYGIDGGRVEPIESTKGKWVARDDAEQAVKDAVWAAKMIVRHGQHLDEMIIPQTTIDDINFSKVEEYVKAIQKRETDEKM